MTPTDAPAVFVIDDDAGVDRKSTRLNSSHVEISYAVFCLKKKNKNTIPRLPVYVNTRMAIMFTAQYMRHHEDQDQIFTKEECNWNPLDAHSVYFFFNDTATTEIYTLSLHDALPISSSSSSVFRASGFLPASDWTIAV